MAKGTHHALPDERNRDIHVYINGEFYPRHEAKISVFDGGYLVGDGVWEGLRLHDGRFAFLDRHLDRLFEGAATIGLDLGMTREQLGAALYDTVARNGMTTDVHVRLMATRGDKLTPSQHPDLVERGPNIVIIAEHKVPDPAITRSGIRLFTATIRRPPPDTLPQQLNSHSKLHEVIALLQAYGAGADEALMLDTDGNVATCNATNFFVARRGEVWTSTGQHCLNGITRGVVIELCREHGIPAFERDFTLVDVYGADEAFVTGTFGGLTPVATVDGRTIGAGVPGPLTARLSELYRAVIESGTE